MTAHDQLRSLLLRVRRRWRAEAVLRATGRASALAAGALLAGAGAGVWLAPADGSATIVAAAMCVAALAVLAATAWRLGVAPGERQIARLIEERVASRPDLEPLDDVLVSAVDGGTPSEGRDFRSLVVETAARRLDAIGATGIVTGRALRRAGAEAAAGVAVFAASIIVAWPMLSRARETAWIALFPQSVQVEVAPGDVRLPAGQPLTIRASVRAGGNKLTRFTPQLTVQAGSGEQQDARTVAMEADGEGFQFSFESVDRSFRYRVTAGTRQSDDYTVTALVAPRVDRIDLRYEYPAFANLPPRDERDGGDIYAPAGTRVRVRVHTDKPIASGQLMFSRGSEGGQPLQPVDERVLEGDLVVARDDSYRIRLMDRDGLGASGDTEYFLRLMDDRPPDVRILRPAGDQQITPLEEVAIEARAEDDHGLSRFELVYAVAGREPKVVTFERKTGTDLTRSGTHTLAAEELGVQPGDVITYYARARDIGRGKRPTESRSDMFFLEVRPFSEEFVLAQSQAMSGMASDQIETLVAAQKEIINATWNIERRAASGAGRSAADIGAIAAAQTELKARAEQMTSRMGRGRGGLRFPQQLTAPQLLGGRPSSDPVGAAISAMTRAIDRLEGQQTSEALPHEMAALQGLLQAQAEVRRREVALQAGAAMGGLGRQGQDLSALFDKELQRQQRTNYETRSQAETRPDRSDAESALDQIRDLAQRQEELSRRQRELASASQPPEELKRQLEKLTREQEELRRQAEALARRMGEQAAQPQRGGASAENQSGAMRDATDQMRSASGELQRQSPGAAAERGERAAAELRRLERDMQRESPAAQQRAAGDVRLEAQQIADEQRRIAGEAARLAKGETTANADGWRRLAGEKDKLADRLDALQKTAEELAGVGPEAASGQGAATASAAKAIANEQIARRMRETAKEMRQPAGPVDGSRGAKPKARQGTADAEQQLARALDRIVDQLGGSEAGAAELSRNLDQARTLRDRLDRLERQIRQDDAARTGRGAAQEGRKAQDGGRAGGRAQAQGQGQSGGTGSASGAAATGDSRGQREQFAKELQSVREALGQLERNSPGAGGGGTTPEQHEWSAVDKGTEAFKQDFSNWESLRRDIDSALDRYEASVIARAARKSLQDRLSAGGSDRVPDDYRQLIARYYESLARKK